MSRRNAQSLIERSATKITLLDQGRKVFYVSPATSAMLATDSESLRGTHILDGVHPQDRAAVDRMCDDLYANPGSTHGTTFRFGCSDGTFRHIQATATNLLEDIQVSGVVMVWEDITQQKRLEESLAAEARRKDEFIAILAHELRNPLAAITNAIYVLKLSGVQDPGVREDLETIERQAKNITTLVGDLMDLSAISKGKTKLVKERMLLCETMRRAAETVKPKLDSHGHKLTIRFPNTPILMEADPTRIEQILTNLLDNAAKYTEPGGVIDFQACIQNGSIHISVKDNGIGIPVERIPYIFDLFFQDDGSRKGGLGIGLTLVKQLVELHGGTITAESGGVCQGSTFTICLPNIVGGSGTCEDDGTKKDSRRILVIEDNHDSAVSLARLLKLFGHEVKVAYRGIDALAMANEFVPDVVLCDIGLPEMDGYEVARRLRLVQPPTLRLVALTGYSSSDDIAKAEHAGFDYHLPKPVNPPDLQRYLAKMSA